jgi:multiple sugar transport system ATP-binding protein
LQVTAVNHGQVCGEVFSFELMGDSTTVTIKVADKFVTARAAKNFRINIGERIEFGVPVERCYLFDEQSQNRMRL